MIKEIYDEKLKIDNVDCLEDNFNNNLPQGTQVTNNHDKSFLIHTTESISEASQYSYFNDSVKPLFNNTNIPLQFLYNILSLGNNSYLLKF